MKLQKQQWGVGLLAFVLMSTVSACGNGNGSGEERPPYPGLPGSADPGGQRNFAALIRGASQAQARQGAWAGYWYPFLENGTASATTRYDRARGGNAATSWELLHHGPDLPGIEAWWGHCNGWAAAAVLSREPREPVSVGGQVFAVAEQKALLSEIWMEVSGSFFGRRSESSSPGSGREFEDMYPNQFFLVLTNYLGRGFSVIMDRYTGAQVWNHPITGYQIAPVRPEDDLGLASSTESIYRVNVAVRVWWLRNDVNEDHATEAFEFADGPSYESRELRFELWLDGPVEFDEQGNVTGSGDVILAREGDFVLGGAWKNGGMNPANSHPDYMWVPSSYARSTGFSNPHLDIGFVSSRFGG